MKKKRICKKEYKIFRQKGFKLFLICIGLAFLFGYFIGYSAGIAACVDVGYNFIEKLGFTKELKDKIITVLHSRGGL